MMEPRSATVFPLLVYVFCQAHAGDPPALFPTTLTNKSHLVTTGATNRSDRLVRAARVGQLSDSTLLHNQWGNLPISEEASNAGGYTSSRCEPITVPLCKGVYYEHTRMPNMFNHETQEEAGLEASISPRAPSLSFIFFTLPFHQLISPFLELFLHFFFVLFIFFSPSVLQPFLFIFFQSLAFLCSFATFSPPPYSSLLFVISCSLHYSTFSPTSRDISGDFTSPAFFGIFPPSNTPTIALYLAF
ncbi:Wnt-activated receptor activity [Sparganum proliferum]